MPDKQCPQCHDMVDEAKAFCPACGHAFVEETKRRDSSEYERFDPTVQMGQTMYNAMLSDMGLNISTPPDPQAERKQAVVQPAIDLKPAAAPQPTPAPVKKSNTKIWVTTIIVALALILIFAAAVIGVAVYLYLRAGRV